MIATDGNFQRTDHMFSLKQESHYAGGKKHNASKSLVLHVGSNYNKHYKNLGQN